VLIPPGYSLTLWLGGWAHGSRRTTPDSSHELNSMLKVHCDVMYLREAIANDRTPTKRRLWTDRLLEAVEAANRCPKRWLRNRRPLSTPETSQRRERLTSPVVAGVNSMEQHVSASNGDELVKRLFDRETEPSVGAEHYVIFRFWGLAPPEAITSSLAQRICSESDPSMHREVSDFFANVSNEEGRGVCPRSQGGARECRKAPFSACRHSFPKGRVEGRTTGEDSHRPTRTVATRIDALGRIQRGSCRG
jgi:hypothetical protein